MVRHSGWLVFLISAWSLAAIAQTKVVPPPVAPDADFVAKREMFDEGCGSAVDLEAPGTIGASIPHTLQIGTGNCWAHASCFALEYEARRLGVSDRSASCDPLLTAIAVKSARYADAGGTIQDVYDKDGDRSGTLVDIDNTGDFLGFAGRSKFGRVYDCGKYGCYCARAPGWEDAPTDLKDYYAAYDLVRRKFEKPGAKIKDPAAWVLDVAHGLDQLDLSNPVRGALNDGVLAEIARDWSHQPILKPKLGHEYFSQKVYGGACLLKPIPWGLKPTDVAPVGTRVAGKMTYTVNTLSADDRAALIRQPLSGAAKMKDVYKALTKELDKSKPVLASFCSNLYDYADPKRPGFGDYVATPKPVVIPLFPAPITNPLTIPIIGKPRKKSAENSTGNPGSAGDCGEHAAAIVGRRMIDGRCYLKVRNSWGGGTFKNPEVRYQMPNGSIRKQGDMRDDQPGTGSHWVPAYLMIQNTYNLRAYGR